MMHFGIYFFIISFCIGFKNENTNRVFDWWNGKVSNETKILNNAFNNTWHEEKVNIERYISVKYISIIP